MSRVPKKEIIYIAGKDKKSMYIDSKSEQAFEINNYCVVLISMNEEPGKKVILTQDTEDSLYVVTKNKKATSVFTYRGNTFSNDKASIEKDCELFNGILLMMWTCEASVDEYHVLFIDTRCDLYKNFSFEIFGYTLPNVVAILNSIFKIAFAELTEEVIKDLRDTPLLNCDNTLLNNRLIEGEEDE